MKIGTHLSPSTALLHHFHYNYTLDIGKQRPLCNNPIITANCTQIDNIHGYKCMFSDLTFCQKILHILQRPIGTFVV